MALAAELAPIPPDVIISLPLGRAGPRFERRGHAEDDEEG